MPEQSAFQMGSWGNADINPMLSIQRGVMRKNCLFLGLIGLFLLCLLCYSIGEWASAPPIKVQISDLVGVWQANYFPDEFSFYDKCAREKVQGVREILILKEDGTYEQWVEKEGVIIASVKNRKWWIEQADKSTAWLHLEKGLYYPHWVVTFCNCLSSEKNTSHCEELARAPWHIMTFNRAMRAMEFNTSKEVVLSIRKPFLSMEIYIEYLLGDPDSPIEVVFRRVVNGLTRRQEQ